MIKSLLPLTALLMGLTLSDIALFASFPILAAAALQVPVGMISDRFDRRIVLILIGLIAVVSDVAFLVDGFTDPLTLLGLSALFGAMIYSMYPVIVAHANDRAAPGTFIQVCGGLLLVYGLGSIFGPTIAGFAMARYGAPSLFAVLGMPHVFLIMFAVFRLKSTQAVEPLDKGSFNQHPLCMYRRRKRPHLVPMRQSSIQIGHKTAGLAPTNRLRSKPCAHSEVRAASGRAVRASRFGQAYCVLFHQKRPLSCVRVHKCP